jgi:putative FmdB family regulatory protein
MPIYEYKCQSCENELEKLQRISDPPLTDCPSCDEPALQRLISAAGFRLKGAGWYETDFKKGSKRNLHDSGDSKSSDSGDSKNSGTKAAATDSKTPSKVSEASKPANSAAGKKSDAA